MSSLLEILLFDGRKSLFCIQHPSFCSLKGILKRNKVFVVFISDDKTQTHFTEIRRSCRKKQFKYLGRYQKRGGHFLGIVTASIALKFVVDFRPHKNYCMTTNKMERIVKLIWFIYWVLIIIANGAPCYSSCSILDDCGTYQSCVAQW